MSAEKDAQIEGVSMDNAENGVIISYSTKTKAPGKGTYDGYTHNYCKEVFDFDDDEGEDFDKAFNRFKELFKQARKYKIKK